jgi:hypothetical protein
MPVGAAGTLRALGGRFIVDVESGHYQPTLQHLLNAVKGLEAHGATLSAVNAQPFQGTSHIVGDVLLEGFRAAKGGATPDNNEKVELLVKSLQKNEPSFENEAEKANPTLAGIRLLKRYLRQVIVP